LGQFLSCTFPVSAQDAVRFSHHNKAGDQIARRTDNAIFLLSPITRRSHALTASVGNQNNSRAQPIQYFLRPSVPMTAPHAASPLKTHEARPCVATNDGLTTRTARALIETHVSLSWLIEGWLPEGGLALLYGPPGIGKSFVALDLALSVAAGLPWPDPEAAATAAAHPVLYWAGEGEYGYGLRLRAWLKTHGLKVEALGERFEMLEGRQYDLSRLNDRQLDAIERQLETRRERHGATPLLVVDTIAALSPSLDENKAEAVGALIAACKRLIAGHERPKATIVLVHHTGKMSLNGPRGHSRFTGDPDVVIRMQSIEAKSAKNDVARVRLTVDKQRNAEPPPQLMMRLERIKIDANGAALAPRIERVAPVSEAALVRSKLTRSPVEMSDSGKRLWAVLRVLSVDATVKIARSKITSHLVKEYNMKGGDKGEYRGLSKNNIRAKLEELKQFGIISIRNDVVHLRSLPETDAASG